LNQVLALNPMKNESDVDRLGLMLIFATAFHLLVILGISFVTDDVKEEASMVPSLEVTLVKNKSFADLDDADYLAQVNQEGGGDTQKKLRPETIFESLLPLEQPELTSLNPPALQPAPKQPNSRTELLTTEHAQEKIIAETLPVQKTKSEQLSAVELISRSMDIASLESEIGQTVQAYSKLPRNKIITARTKEYLYASYMNSWRQKVERIGNLNFPAEAKKNKLSGELILDVMLKADGTIYEIEVVRSSGHSVLDNSAIRIVHLSSPFAPFSQAMKKETDILHIIRTWKFIGGKAITAR